MKKNMPLKYILNWVAVAMFCFMLLGPIIHRSPYSDILVVAICLLEVTTHYRHMRRQNAKAVLEIGFFSLYGLIIVMITGGGIGGIYSILSGLVVFMAFRESKLTRVQLGLIFSTLFFICLYWIYKSPEWYDLFMYYKRRGEGLFNPNGVGQIICDSGILLFILFSQMSNRWILLMRWPFMAICIWGIYNSHGRMSLAVIIGFLILVFIFDRVKKNKNIFLRLAFVGAIIAEIVVPPIYLWLFRKRFAVSYAFFGLKEKGLYSGRESIWEDAFNGMKTFFDWMIGVGSKQDYWSGHVLNMHNNAMNLLVVVGVIGLVWYFLFLYRLVFKGYDADRAADWQNYMLLFFICIIFNGCTDITIFYNQFLLYFYMPLGMACNTEYSEKLFEMPIVGKIHSGIL